MSKTKKNRRKAGINKIRNYLRKPERVYDGYERIITPEGWIVINTSTGHMVTVNDRYHVWELD